MSVVGHGLVWLWDAWLGSRVPGSLWAREARSLTKQGLDPHAGVGGRVTGAEWLVHQPQTPGWRPRAFKIDRPFLSVHSAPLHPSMGVCVLLMEPQEQVKPSGRCHGPEQGLGTLWLAQRHREEVLERAMQGTWPLLDPRTPKLTSGGIQAPRGRAPSAGQHPCDPRTLLSCPDLVHVGTSLWSWRDRYVGPGCPRSPCDGPREGKGGVAWFPLNLICGRSRPW